MSDKPWEDCTREELIHVGRAYEMFGQQTRATLDDLLVRWEDLDDDEKRQQVESAYASQLINPRPLPDEELAVLRRLEGLPEPAAPKTRPVPRPFHSPGSEGEGS